MPLELIMRGIMAAGGCFVVLYSEKPIISFNITYGLVFYHIAQVETVIEILIIKLLLL